MSGTEDSSKYCNLRRACAAKVTVFGLSVCLSTTILRLQATRRLMSDTNSFSANNMAILLKRLRYSVKNKRKSIMSTGLLRPGLACSAHRGRINLLRRYVSKSSAVLNPLTITQLACELSMRGRSRTALRGPGTLHSAVLDQFSHGRYIYTHILII